MARDVASRREKKQAQKKYRDFLSKVSEGQAVWLHRTTKPRPLPNFATTSKGLASGLPRTPQHLVAAELESWLEVWRVQAVA